MTDKNQMKLILEQIDNSSELALFFTRLTEPDPALAKLFFSAPR